MATLRLQQLGGAQREFLLTGHAAPHGRPRADPVATDALRIRNAEVFVAGQVAPVRHIFGYRYEPLEFRGRLLDRWAHVGFAEAKAAEAKGFVAEMERVKLSWDGGSGAAIACTGIVLELDIARESHHEIAWRILFAVDRDELLGTPVTANIRTKLPRDYTYAITYYLNETQAAFEEMKLRGSVFDLFDNLISGLASLVSNVVILADELASFQKATFATVRRFRHVLGQLRTAALSVRDTIDAFEVDAAIEARNAREQFSFVRNQAIISDSTLAMITEVAEADRAAQLAEQGRVKAIVQAFGGDTFETLAVRSYGSAERAADIREANDVVDGALPVFGQLYMIPV